MVPGFQIGIWSLASNLHRGERAPEPSTSSRSRPPLPRPEPKRLLSPRSLRPRFAAAVRPSQSADPATPRRPPHHPHVPVVPNGVTLVQEIETHSRKPFLARGGEHRSARRGGLLQNSGRDGPLRTSRRGGPLQHQCLVEEAEAVGADLARTAWCRRKHLGLLCHTLAVVYSASRSTGTTLPPNQRAAPQGIGVFDCVCPLVMA